MVLPRSMLLQAALSLDTSSFLKAPSQGSAPSVTIQNGTLIGQRSGNLDSFLGIPFAQPPIGSLRLRPPQPINSSYGTLTLPTIPRACPQMNQSMVNTSGLPKEVAAIFENIEANYTDPQGEDCLSINVQRPANLSADAKLPVLFWIFGGGYEVGSTAKFNATSLINRSLAMKSPIVFVAVNYRVNAYGFLQGKQLSEEGSTNLGLRDQRMGLEWVAENIAAFGGDPGRVTIWGESAGSVSVFDQLLINDGDNTYRRRPLFHGAIMDSGSLIRTVSAESSKAQAIFDRVASAADCDPSSPGVLACLRAVPYELLQKATLTVPGYLGYQGLDVAFTRRQDPASNFYSSTPEEAIQQGKFARVPVIIGDQEDEGPLFAVVQRNLTTADELVDYVASWFPDATRKVVSGLVATYPNNSAAGSPFDTGEANQLYPQFKRNAALQGDALFTLARRQALTLIAQHLPSAWSYLATYLYGFPILGTYHTSDIDALFGGQGPAAKGNQEYYINFVNTQNPNGPGLTHWPQWDESGLQMINISRTGVSLLKDDFRWESYEYFVKHTAELRQ